MGEFTWPVGVWSADGERLETVDALVDTGASYSMFPASMLYRLGIVPLSRRRFVQADGSVVLREIGRALLRINGDEDVQRVIFGEDDVEPLIGASALQGFLLVVDAVEERLVSRDGRLKAQFPARTVSGRGKFWWPVEVSSQDGARRETVDALVDTGSSYSVFPRSMLERLGVWRLERVGFERADGSIIEMDVGMVWMTVNGQERAATAAFGPDDAEPLLGANALQEFLLTVDPVKERLIPRTGRI